MGSYTFILKYVNSCINGNLPFKDCGDVWQFGVIVVMLLIAIVVLLALLANPQQQTPQS